MNRAVDIENLRIAHWSPRAPLLSVSGPGVCVDTCLRQVYIDMATPATPGKVAFGGRHPASERRGGAEAYRLLLEIMTGLRSAIPGETNVLGQFKDAWLAFRRDRQPAEVARLAPLMHRLINDTKTIRAAHLQGIGGASYGSLVRRLLMPRTTTRILFVGAGNLAESMLPLFKNFEVGLWNYRDIQSPAESVRRLFRPDEGRHAARWADQVILTTPPDPTNDRHWQRWIADTQIDAVIHLGHRQNMHRMHWGQEVRTFDLADVFILRRAQADIRSEQLAKARAACGQCAGLYATENRPIASASWNAA